MTLHFFDESSGLPLADADIYELARTDGKCSCSGLTVSASSAVDALTENRRVTARIETNSFVSRPSCHEFLFSTERALVGVFPFQFEGILPNAIEAGILGGIRQGIAVLKDSSCLCFGVGCNALPSDNFVRLAEVAQLRAENTFFHLNSSSTIVSSPISVGMSRVTRHLEKSYENYGKPYGFLELFRALEACFFASLLKKLESEFLGKPRKTLDAVQRSLKDENKSVLSVIHTCKAEPVAEIIAEKITRLSGAGNKFAVEIVNKFNARDDKNTDRVWQASCFLFSIRCSIAHAGTEDLVFEDYDDGDALLAEVHACFEELALATVGIQRL